MCCMVLQCVGTIQNHVVVCDSVLQCVAMCCRELQCDEILQSHLQSLTFWSTVIKIRKLQGVAACCRVLQCVAACWSVLQWMYHTVTVTLHQMCWVCFMVCRAGCVRTVCVCIGVCPCVCVWIFESVCVCSCVCRRRLQAILYTFQADLVVVFRTW